MSKTRLSVMPFVVLLPKLGEASALSRLSPLFEKRLGELEDQEADDGTGHSSKAEGRSGEEMMLKQVLQWLTMTGET